MPLPSRRKGEEKSKFISRCVSFMTEKGEGKDTSQRVAICNTRADNSLTDEEMEVMAALWILAKQPTKKPGVKVTDLSPPLKKKKKDKFRNTKRDGSGTDDTV